MNPGLVCQIEMQSRGQGLATWPLLGIPKVLCAPGQSWTWGAESWSLVESPGLSHSR